MSKPLVIFVFSFEGSATSTRYGGFAKRLQKAGGLVGCDVLTVALENLLFVVREDGSADVIDSVSGQSLGSAALVYLKARWGLPEEASALANFLLHKGIPFMDTSSLGTVMSKISTIMRLWGNGIPVPFTVYSRRHDLLIKILYEYRAILGEKFILKDTQGAKGKTNFLTTLDEAPNILAQYPDVQFIAQRFVPNNGDYRVGVYVNKSGFAIKRVGSGKTHLNNVSAGGTAEYVDITDMPTRLLRLAEKAAAAVDLQIAGVDVIVDKLTNKPYILEVNQGSQIVTGAFVDQNIKALNTALEGAVRERYSRTRKQPTRMIGRRAWARLKSLGIERVAAKIDTGAYSSTLHAENIHISKNSEGIKELVFDIVPSKLLILTNDTALTIKTTEFFDQKIRSSNGQLQHRYSIKTRISIEGKIFPVVLTLSDRSEMGYPLLIGRRVLRSRFLVNVELNENNQTEWRY
jgi:glutathione synthase/RimK-type ligase-like ATP-grasp enzyme